ncbi:substrate-binding periplasmic protein [Tahibacter amnicola]|uniref:Transporter substrate-binding domain-containing protein n=1 Tax=Tahibacter amnicola TaxID=2976241 RepID=A0ABY6BBJ8_9GAMM|nr:transporter substrate-binding domain-containing protein [Tahibacter amnicola]UXI66523.1 transporter substrate-binding domain-containing protein [Tahibacter amnicola]
MQCLALAAAGFLGLLAGTLPDTAAAPAPRETRLYARLASLEWAPYVGENMRRQGYAADVVRTACARHAVDVEIDFLPWARALLQAVRGDYAGLMPEYYDASRLADFEFSAGFPGGPVALYKRRGEAITYGADPRRDPEAAWRSLTSYRFGVVRGYLNNPSFDAADYLAKEEAASDVVNLRKLAYGRVDLVFVDSAVAEYLMAHSTGLQPGVLEMLPPAIEEKPLYIAWSRRAEDMAQLRARCDAGLAEITADGTLFRLRAEHGIGGR